jgi:hexosaminidase
MLTTVRNAIFVLLLAAMLAPAAAAQETISVIPQPVKLERQRGQFTLRADTAIIADAANWQTAGMLADWLAPATGFRLRVRDGAPADNAVILRIDATLERLGEEGYRLEATARRVEIRAPRPAGVFYGVQTLRQLLPTAVFAPVPQLGVAWTVPAVRIEDYPRFVWRGAHLDVARHFMPVWFVKKYIDLLAMHKMNVFHWHLTDDQGWRIEIKKYPRLTEVGAWRKESRLGHERYARGFDKVPHGGFYSQDEIRDVVEYARQRFVTVVPEIEMPGHAQAAIAAYPELGVTGQPLEVWTRWGINANIFNPSEKTIAFLQDVLAEVLELFPSTFIHVGGDEAIKDQWQASAEVQARIRELGLKDEHELQSYFIRRMEEWLRARGRRLIGWDEILEGGLPPGATVMSWRGVEGGITAAQSGHDVVMAPTTHTYLDYYQSEAEGEPHAIGGYVNLEKVYSFEPIPDALTDEEARHVLGAQCQVWTEYMKGPGAVEYMAFPRALALAEVVWTPKERKDFANFLERMKKKEERLAHLDVNFRPTSLPH